jgi:hypothetical protein
MITTEKSENCNTLEVRHFRRFLSTFRSADALFYSSEMESAQARYGNCITLLVMARRTTFKAFVVAKRVVFAAEGKDQDTWAKFVEALEKHNGHRHAITQASMDMSAAYQAGVRENCPNAQVVFDKFHVIKNANHAVEKVRRAEVRLGGQGVWEALHKSQWLWRKNPENLTVREQRGWARSKTKISPRPRPIKCGWFCKTSTDRRKQAWRGIVFKCGVAGSAGPLDSIKPVSLPRC